MGLPESSRDSVAIAIFTFLTRPSSERKPLTSWSIDGCGGGGGGVSDSGDYKEFMVFTASGLQLTIASASATMKVLKDSSSSWVP